MIYRRIKLLIIKMNQGIWYNIGIHLDYETLIILCSSNYFWIKKCQNDFKINEVEVDSIISYLGTARETYIYYAGINNIPLIGTEKYGRLGNLIVAAINIGDDHIIEYFYKFHPRSYLIKYMAIKGKDDLIFSLHKKYPVDEDLYTAMQGAIIGNQRHLIAQLAKMTISTDVLNYVAAETGNLSLYRYVAEIHPPNYYKSGGILVSACRSQNHYMISYVLAMGDRKTDSIRR